MKKSDNIIALDQCSRVELHLITNILNLSNVRIIFKPMKLFPFVS